jgi:hypothetical protein
MEENPDTVKKGLERVRRWLDKYDKIRLYRNLSVNEKEIVTELNEEEQRLLALTNSITDEIDLPVPSVPSIPLTLLEIDSRLNVLHLISKSRVLTTDELEEWSTLRESERKLRSAAWQQPGDLIYGVPKHLIGKSVDWDKYEKEQRERIARDARGFVEEMLNRDIFGGVPGDRRREPAPEQLDSLKDAVKRARALVCKHCKVAAPRCECDKPSCKPVACTVAMDWLEIDWKQEGFSFDLAVTEENVRRSRLQKEE